MSGKMEIRVDFSAGVVSGSGCLVLYWNTIGCIQQLIPRLTPYLLISNRPHLSVLSYRHLVQRPSSAISLVPDVEGAFNEVI